MPLLSGTIPSFIGGVSQQDASVRLLSQLESAINCDLSPAHGAGKRAPAQFVAGLGTDIPEDASFHQIHRDAREKYIVMVGGNKVRVFDHVTGHEYSVVMADGSEGYLDTQYEDWKSIRSVTVEDYTFIANREVTVKMTGSVVPGAVSGSFQDFSDLPTKGQGVGKIYTIAGDSTNAFDNYWVEGTSSTVYEECAKPGAQNELDKATMPHVLKRIPDGTRPDGLYFAFGPIDWGKRLSGDEDAAPAPSFVGSEIGNMFFHRDRLGILAGQSVVMSEVGKYFNFWRTTITSLLDSDPIDVVPPVEGVSELTHAVSYQKALLLFSSGKTSMFQLSGTPSLTPSSVTIDPVTDYEVSPYVSPVVAGSSVFFINDSTTKAWTTMREYFVSDTQVTPDAAEVTAHVPEYVPPNIRTMASVPDYDVVAMAHSGSEGSQVFLHQFKWEGDQKEQSAWHEWKLSGVGAVQFVAALGQTLYLVARAPGGGSELLSIDLAPTAVLPEVTREFNVLMDRREVVTPSYQALGNYTDLDLPFVVSALDDMVVMKTTDWANPGALADLRNASLQNGGSTLRFQGNIGTGRLVVGFKYTQRVGVSQQFIRDRNNVSTLIGRLQLRRMTVRFNQARYFKCIVTPRGRSADVNPVAPTRLNTYTGRTLADASLLTDTAHVASGTFTFLVGSRSDQVGIAFENDSPYPAWFQSAQWEALYATKVRM